ncbi:MAG: DUF370 domain-containing protein [Clostridiales bacterium]|nr:DUF370 domain-containing protein [Candidatus Equinaster intestinalis]
MYIHLGLDTVIKQEDIIGIFDLDTSTVSRHTRDYLSKAEKRKEIINVTEELPKSFIVCAEKNNKEEKKVYISQISSVTLLKRSDFLSVIE